MKTESRPAWLCLLALAAVLIVALPVGAAEYTYRDKLGRVVTVATPVKRAAMFQLYDFLPALDAWDQVSCLARYCMEDKLMMAAESARVRRLSAGMGGSDNLNMEKLINLKPDLVLIWSSSKQQIEYMERRGLKVIAVFPESLTELYSLMDLLGQLFDRSAAMAATKQHMQTMLNLVHSRVMRIAPAQRQKILWISTRPTSVTAGLGLNNDLIRLIGATNVAGKIRERNVQVSLEQIIKWNPDVIIIVGRATYTAADVMRNQQWRTIRAVRHGRVYKAPNWIGWSPMVAPTALWMAAKTYPAAFSDINLNARVDQFCRQVYGVDLQHIGVSID